MTYGSRQTEKDRTRPVVEVTDVDFTYQGAATPALTDINLSITPHDRVALIGPNGAGKSTLIRLIAGLDTPQSGQLRVYGTPIQASRDRVAYVPQRTEVNWRFPIKVKQVVMQGRYVHLGWLKWPRPVDHQAVAKALDTLGITDLAERQIGELSGGQQQRVMLARALAQQADILVLDEPLNNLDTPTQALILDLLEDLTQQGVPVLLSTHDLGHLHRRFNRAIFLNQEIVADGPTEKVLNSETLASTYGMTLNLNGGQPHA